jgi:uncharacterized protein (TIGR00725 family)
MDFIDKIPIIGVMGSGSQAHQEKSDALGKWIAQSGYHLLTGGGNGVMAAVSKSFCQTTERKGYSIGIIPGNTEDDLYKPAEGYPNPWIEIPIRTHLPLSGIKGTSVLSRNHINILSSHVIIALPGSDGTKSEIILALKYKRPILGFFQSATREFGENLKIECIDSFKNLTIRINKILGK